MPKIPLESDDEVAGVTNFQSFIVVVTRKGHAFKLVYNSDFLNFTVMRL